MKIASKKSSKAQALFLIVVGVLLIVGCIVWFVWREQPQPFSTGDEVVTVSVDTPDERRPDPEQFVWRGASDDPKKITIDRISETGFIQKVGIDQFGRVAVPNNIFVAGWFVDSVKPGEKGLSIIDGHVNGLNVSEGLFANLGELREGDMVEMTFGDDSVKKFEVMTVASMPTEEAASALFSQSPSIERQMNLITCAGYYDDEIETFTERVIVTTRLVEV